MVKLITASRLYNSDGVYESVVISKHWSQLPAEHKVLSVLSIQIVIESDALNSWASWLPLVNTNIFHTLALRNRFDLLKFSVSCD